MIFDAQRNLYGTASNGGVLDCPGGEACGVIYKLTPGEGGWTQSIVHSFTGSDGGDPYGGLIADAAGNFYGITFFNGVVYELTPSGGSMSFNVIDDFNDYEFSYASLVMDSAGNLYGTNVVGSPEVFKISYANGQWRQTGFSGQAGDTPYGSVIVDATGNVYTTTSAGGDDNAGVVLQIVP